MGILLGCIADDFTGATDLACMLQREGMRTILVIGVPAAPLPADIDADAIVVALKSRTAAPERAVADSLAAYQWLSDAGAQQVYFKYCSTFDSTDQGNIGPVIDALMSAAGAEFTIACPAFPDNQRTVYQGHLFVGSQLLAESGMREHPLTPMTDSNLVRVLQRQTPSAVDLISHDTVATGAVAIGARMHALQTDGKKIAVVDAVSNEHLMQIGAAAAALRIVTGGSGLALGIPQNFKVLGLLQPGVASDELPPAQGWRAIICGSCSQASQAQLADLIGRGTPAYGIDPLQLAAPGGAQQAVVADIKVWAESHLEKGPVVVYATAAANDVRKVQDALGAERAGALIEKTLAAVARELVTLGVHQLIVAGGETSGAVVTALNIDRLRIGRQIDPGVPWTVSLGNAPIALALKSGNFGSVDFFTKAWDVTA